MDLLDDFLSEPPAVKAPAANRFKPKAKPRPQKGLSVAAKATKEKPVKSVGGDSVLGQTVQSNDFADKQLDFTINESSGTKETSISEAAILENQLLAGNLAEPMEVEDLAGAGYSETVVPRSSEGGHLGEDNSLGLQFPEDIIGRSTAAPNLPVELETLDASNAQNEVEISAFPEVSFASACPFRKCTQNPHELSTPSTYQDSGYYKEDTVSSVPGEVWIEIEEGAVGFSCLEDGDMMDEAASASGKRPVKFQPKPKQIGREKDAQELSSENQNLNGDASVYTGEPQITSSLSNANPVGNFSMNPNTSQPDKVVYEDADSWMAQNLPEQCGKHGKSMASDALNPSDKSLDGGTEPNEDGYEINDGMNNGVQHHRSEQLATIVGDDSLGNETSKKKRQRKCKKAASENNESGGKKSNIAKVPDQSADKPPKKVPRAPRRKRCVDKALLEAPEDEIDLQRVPIRDLIILAEYKERQAKKNAAAVQPSLNNERTENTLSEDPPYYDDDGNILDYEENGDSFDNPSTSAVVKDTSYFNYHSFMDKSKTTKVRWSKEDTELFYQGIREFGSDFLMIQKMHFPGRTRNQIRLKYKKEERENPVLLHAAMNSRAKDLSHFERLAQQLRKEAAEKEAEENQMSDEDDPTGPSGEEEGRDEGTLGTHATSKEATKPEEEGMGADQEPETAQDGSPAKSYDIEDDFNWDDYKSEL